MHADEPPFLALPGFEPDAVPYAVRTSLSLLLAYFICFAAQIPPASTAGICVMLVAQPSAGMAFSKAIYRQIGTTIGGVVAIGLLAAFPQDRTMLLMGFALWIGLCNFVATLLRDFRSYGAALSGYTVGIIAIAAIDTPNSGWVNALNRLAAITVGILSVMVVNSLLRSNRAFDGLVRDLRQALTDMRALAADALGGHLHHDDMALITLAAKTASLQTQAVYAATELPDGRARANGARFAIAGLLASVSDSRAIARTLPHGAGPTVQTYLAAMSASIVHGAPHPGPAPHPATPIEAVLLDRADALATALDNSRAGLRMLQTGEHAVPPTRLGRSYDPVAALLGAIRTVIGVSLVSLFCVLGAWPGATLVLIQTAAFMALLGTQPNPSKASIAFLVPLVPMTMLAAFVTFFALPIASGFVPFALAIGSAAFVTALAARHKKLLPYGAAALLYLPLLVGPSNSESFDVGSFANTVLQVTLSVVFTTLAFNLVLPVSPSRRLYRLAAAIVGDLRRTRRQDQRTLHVTVDHARLYDRLAQALTWLGRRTPARLHLLSDMLGAGEVDLAVRRARGALAVVRAQAPALAGCVTQAEAALASGEAATLLGRAQDLLDRPAGGSDHAVRQAVSGLMALAWLTAPHRPAGRFVRLMGG